MDVKTLCLGVLSTGPHSGYEIKKAFEESFHYFFRASFGSIYPALAELEREGGVVCEAVAQARRPDKKVYAITRAGRDALRAALMREEPRHVVRSEFLVLLYFAHLLPPERLAAVIDTMTVEFERIMHSDLESYERNHAELTPGQRFALGYGRTMLTAALGYLHRQRGQLLREVTATDETGRPRVASDLAVAGD